MTIDERQQEIIEEFEMFPEWMQRYEYIIELGKDCPMIEEGYKTEDYLIKGCQSRVWMHARKDDDGLMRFTADSDAIITKGLAALVVRVFDGLLPEQIVKGNIHFIQDIGLNQHLSPTRSNGLASMIQRMKMEALAHTANHS